MKPVATLMSPTTGSLAAGTYTASLTITSSVASNSPQAVSVTFTVAPQPSPQIALSASSRTFTATEGAANPTAQTVSVTNGGGGSLTGLGAAVAYPTGQPAEWLVAGLSSAAAPATLTLTVTTGSLTAGSYTAIVSVTSATADNSPQVVTVTFTVAPAAVAPLIELSSMSLSFSGEQGGAQPEEQTVQVTNGGGGTLDQLDVVSIQYEAGQPTGWLDAVLDASTAPTTLTFLAQTVDLGVGTYNASVEVASPVASNTPQTVTVTLSVTTPPEGLLYAVHREHGGLSTINPRTGVGRFVGRLDPSAMEPTGMAVRPSDGKIFVWHTRVGGDPHVTSLLLTVDPTTGQAAQTDATPAFIGALAFSPAGVLFGLAWTGYLSVYRVDPSTASITLIGQDDFEGQFVSGADFDCSTGTLYAVGSGFEFSELVTINTSTGDATHVAQLSGDISEDIGGIGSIAFSPAGTLIASARTSSGGSVLFDINKASGEVSNVRPISGQNVGFPTGMGFLDSCN